MIDFDDSSTFPNVIRQWVLNQKGYFEIFNGTYRYKCYLKCVYTP